jgi:hypothetical protein
MSSDWLNVEMDRLYVVQRRAVEMPLDVRGRCGHGFEKGLCAEQGCAAYGDPKFVRVCSACARPYAKGSRFMGNVCPRCSSRRAAL